MAWLLGWSPVMVLPQRERQDHPDQEQEQREDQVVEAEAFPFDVLELVAEAPGLRRAPPFANARATESPPTIQNMSKPRRASDRGEALHGAGLGFFGELVGNGGHGSSCEGVRHGGDLQVGRGVVEGERPARDSPS